MNWVKANWLIIVLSVIAVAALPVMFFFSMKLNRTLREQVNTQVQADMKEVSNSTVTYSVPDVQKPDGKSFEVKTDVNERLTKLFATSRDAIKRESSQIGGAAVKFNEGEHRPLVNGLFPQPSASDRNRVMNQFAREYIERLPGQILESANAKPPLDAAILGSRLRDYKNGREETAQAVGGAGEMTAEDAAKLNQELLAARIDQYKVWANQITMYASPTALTEVIPAAIPNPLPTMSQLWDWQTRAWILNDVFKAMSLANSSSGSGDGSVLSGVVKRLIKIQVDSADFQNVSDEQAPADAGMDLSASTVTTKNPVTPNYAVSLSGRYSGPSTGNQYYDLRKVTLDLVVAPDKLPALFDAIASVNFMTVLKCDLMPAEVEADLREGYYYGNDHVMRAVIVVETVWLREWTKKYMPPVVRQSLGVVDEKAADAEGADGGAGPQ